MMTYDFGMTKAVGWRDRRGTSQPNVRLERKNVGARLAPWPKYGEGAGLDDWLVRIGPTSEARH